MIIVEGTDLTGKTTLCKKLVEQLQAEGEPHTYQHLSKLPRGWDHFWDYRRASRRRIVQDRFHDSDLAYRAACHEACDLDERPGLYELVEARVRLLGCVKVLLTADDVVLRRRYEDASQKRQEMFGVGVVQSANTWFCANFARCRWDLHHHASHWDEYPPRAFVAKVLDAYRQRQDTLDRVIHSTRRHDDGTV